MEDKILKLFNKNYGIVNETLKPYKVIFSSDLIELKREAILAYFESITRFVSVVDDKNFYEQDFIDYAKYKIKERIKSYLNNEYGNYLVQNVGVYDIGQVMNYIEYYKDKYNISPSSFEISNDLVIDLDEVNIILQSLEENNFERINRIK